MYDYEAEIYDYVNNDMVFRLLQMASIKLLNS